MSDPNRVRRQQILREAEGYLDLITVFGGRWPCRPDARDQVANRVLATLDRIDNPGGLRGHIQFLRGQALRTMERYADAVKPLREAADLEPGNFHIRLALGWCYKRVRRLDLAIQVLEEAPRSRCRAADSALQPGLLLEPRRQCKNCLLLSRPGL